MPFGRGVVLTVRAGLSSLRLISPFVRSRAASLAGAAALLVAYSAAAVSPALITQQLVDRGLAAGDVPLDAPAGWMAGRDDGYVAARVTEASGVSALFSKTSFAFASSALQAAGSAVAVAAMSPAVLAFALVPIPAYVWCAGRSLKAYRASVACVPSSKNRQIRLSNFDTLMLTASGRAGAVAAGPPAA